MISVGWPATHGIFELWINSTPRNELVDQERVLRQRLCGLNQILRNQIRHFVPETQNRRGLDSYQGTFRANNVLQQFYIADRQPSRIAMTTS
jgi:hypothetical protein